jgi:hypothetical protein
LLHAKHGAVAKITFHEKHDLVILNKDLVAQYSVKPALHRSLDANFIFVGSSTSRSNWRWNCGDKSFRVGRDQVVSELNELRVSTANIAILGGTEFGDIGLSSDIGTRSATIAAHLISIIEESTHVNVKAKDRILLSSPLKTSDLGLDLIGRRRWPRGLSNSTLEACGELLSLLVGDWGLLRSKRRRLLAVVWIT